MSIRCMLCDRIGHNSRTCPSSNQCSLCGVRGHNARACPNSVQCSWCKEIGHNVRGCPNTVTCSKCGQPGHNASTCNASIGIARGYERERQLQRDLDSLELPRGKIDDLHRKAEWHHRDILIDKSERELKDLDGAVKRLKEYTQFSAAVQRIMDRVHKASKYIVYVGRAGMTSEHLLNRFRSHENSRRARFISPVLCARTDIIKDEKWEDRAIRLVNYWNRKNKLCCNNNVCSDGGGWPSTSYSLIYVVACERRSQE